MDKISNQLKLMKKWELIGKQGKIIQNRL